LFHYLGTNSWPNVWSSWNNNWWRSYMFPGQDHNVCKPLEMWMVSFSSEFQLIQNWHYLNFEPPRGYKPYTFSLSTTYLSFSSSWPETDPLHIFHLKLVLNLWFNVFFFWGTSMYHGFFCNVDCNIFQTLLISLLPFRFCINLNG